MSTRFLDEAQGLFDELVAIRRDLHQHPELGFQEYRTSRVVAEKLSALGYEVITGVAETGVVGLLPGGQPGAGTVLLRFDMDALPIQEANDVPYRSQTPGVMHACGHDGHVAIGLGVATILARHRDELGGTVKLMFQPAEEGLGGADRMIAEGVLADPRPDAAFAVHVSSTEPIGTAAMSVGPMMAAADKLQIVVYGKGGHAAHPEQATDAVLVAAHIVVALQTIVSRNLSADDAGVITVGSLQAGTASNVIAETATLTGSIRSFEPGVRELLHRRIQEVAEGIAAALGARAEVVITRGVNPTVNAEAPTLLVRDIASALLGGEQVRTNYRTLGAEDFSAVLDAVPGAFVFVGARNEARGLTAPHHNPHFDFDEACLPTGVALLCEAAVQTLRAKHS
jgi:amidohydrolase